VRIVHRKYAQDKQNESLIGMGPGERAYDREKENESEEEGGHVSTLHSVILG